MYFKMCFENENKNRILYYINIYNDEDMKIGNVAINETGQKIRKLMDGISYDYIKKDDKEYVFDGNNNIVENKTYEIKIIKNNTKNFIGKITHYYILRKIELSINNVIYEFDDNIMNIENIENEIQRYKINDIFIIDQNDKLISMLQRNSKCMITYINSKYKKQVIKVENINRLLMNITTIIKEPKFKYYITSNMNDVNTSIKLIDKKDTDLKTLLDVYNNTSEINHVYDTKLKQIVEKEKTENDKVEECLNEMINLLNKYNFKMNEYQLILRRGK